MSSPIHIQCNAVYDTANDSTEQMLDAARCLVDFIEQAQAALLDLSNALETRQGYVVGVQTRIAKVRSVNI
jgi:predicted DNA-binding ArsR family transcriptional regulator